MAKHLEVRQLSVFVALVESRGISAAARALGLAQSTVSEALAALERTLGSSVVDRRSVKLTPAGEALLPHARAILAAVDAAQREVARAANAVRGTVEITACESVSAYLLPPALAPLRERWPSTRFSVSVAPCDDVAKGIANGTFDVGFQLEWPARSSNGAEHHVLADELPLVVFARDAHPMARRAAALRADELERYPLFISDAAGDFPTQARRMFRARTIESAGTVEGVKRAVSAAPDALGLLPGYALTEELRAGRFRRVHVRPSPTVALGAVLSTARPRHPAVKELLATLAVIREPARDRR